LFPYLLGGGVEGAFSVGRILSLASGPERTGDAWRFSMPLKPKIRPIKVERHFDDKNNLQMAIVTYSNNETTHMPFLDFLGEMRLKRKLRHNELVVDMDDNYKYIFVCQFSPLNRTQQFIKIKCLCPTCRSIFYTKLHRAIRMLRQNLSPFCCGTCRAAFNQLKADTKNTLREKMTSFKFIEGALNKKSYSTNEDPYLKYKLSYNRRNID
jgi:hypothetical protein